MCLYKCAYIICTYLKYQGLPGGRTRGRTRQPWRRLKNRYRRAIHTTIKVEGVFHLTNVVQRPVRTVVRTLPCRPFNLTVQTCVHKHIYIPARIHTTGDKLIYGFMLYYAHSHSQRSDALSIEHYKHTHSYYQTPACTNLQRRAA